MRFVVALCVLMGGCKKHHQDSSDGDDTDLPPPLHSEDTNPDSDSGGSGDTGTPTPPEPPSCDEGTDPITVVAGDTYPDLQAALDAASAGDVILICRGTYAGPFVAPVSVKLIGLDGPDFTILDGQGLGTTLTLVPNSTVKGLRMTHGAATAGGGVVLSAAGLYMIEESAVLSNTAEEGGGIWAAPGAGLHLSDTVVADNTAARGGGIYADLHVDLDLGGAQITQNTADDNGGGIYALSELNVIAGTVNLNVVSSTDDTAGGGGIYVLGPASIAGTILDSNEAHRGGGLRLDDGTTSTLTSVSITNNAALDAADADGRGGGLYLQGGKTNVAGAPTLSGNSADLGGGVFLTGGAVLTGAPLSANTATLGGGAYLQGATASGVTLEDNTATSGGGAVIDDAGTLVASTVMNNTATLDGGGVWAGARLADSLGLGLLELPSTTVSGNTAVMGGGIAVTGQVTLVVRDASHVEDNTATGTGGGAWVADTAVLESDAAGWGEDALDNDPDDIFAGTTSYSGYTTLESFSCISGVCSPAP